MGERVTVLRDKVAKIAKKTSSQLVPPAASAHRLLPPMRPLDTQVSSFLLIDTPLHLHPFIRAAVLFYVSEHFDMNQTKASAHPHNKAGVGKIAWCCAQEDQNRKDQWVEGV